MNDAWLTMNQRYLSRALATVRTALERYAAPDAPETITDTVVPANTNQDLPPAALDALCAAFNLTEFERDVLLFCAGAEFDGGFGALCARAHRNPAMSYPTFGLALAALKEPHWSALSPEGTLRRWRLVELTPGDEPLTRTRLRIAERVLHHLAGVSCEEDGLRGLVYSVEASGDLAPSQQVVAEAIAQLLARARGGNIPVVQLCGRADGDARAIAAAACWRLGLGLRAMRAGELPANASERLHLARLWEREAALGAWGLLIEVDDHDPTDAMRTLAGFLELVRGVVLLAVREPLRGSGRGMVKFEVGRPQPAEQRALWQTALGAATAELNGSLDAVLSHFDLSAGHVRSVSAQALLVSKDQAPLETAIWEACRSETRPRLDGLAQRIVPAATWNELVLPEPQVDTLREIAAQLRQRHRVYHAWGFAAKGSRSLGITALFAGPSGTGKTFAAEVLAAELRLDLFRIDLSQVVSKYIGETEKNLRRLFDAAEGSGAILLFDEADALFGKRTEVKDSHDRFANIEVSYLLQQMEAYRGLAILTTNLKHAIDPAFLRRIRFVVQFPFPGPAERAEIWRRIFPAATPTEDLKVDRLARLNVPGGNIRTIAVNAAFRAADEGVPVRMSHLLRAARSEYEKLEKPLTESETGGWV
jgi:hypothetical protein